MKSPYLRHVKGEQSEWGWPGLPLGKKRVKKKL
jgi:hypothetical protein